ncbi:virulence factor [Ilumatobacter sp.]|uniref:virulence factor n=1 Tax=Ilumatobacter sp. TaxID=1967498 RepID=UPI003B528DF1
MSAGDGVARPSADLGPDQGSTRERRSSARRGRRSGGALTTIAWRDIPAQLTARSGGDQHKVLLHARFQHAIDRAAAVAGLTSTNDYVQRWRSTAEPLPETDDVAELLERRSRELDDEYPRARLEALVANGGLEPGSDDGRAAAAEHPNEHDRRNEP